jgi:hypothetical protein
MTRVVARVWGWDSRDTFWPLLTMLKHLPFK